MNLTYNKTTTYSFILLLVLVVPIGIVHELGHALVCYGENLTVELRFAGFGLATKCSAQPVNFTVFTASGSLLAMLTSLLPLLFFRQNHIKIACLTLALTHGLNGLVETVLFDSYIRNITLYMAIINTVMIIIFIMLLAKLNSKTVNQTSLVKK